jgi:thiamine-phosphate pyrophosphorylase
MKHIGRLHILTDTQLQKRFSHCELTEMAIAGGADTIQFRQKHGSTRELIETARAMRELCAGAGLTFIVNDRIDVAIASNADGVHLGQDDFSIPLARKLIGDDKIIGGSAGNVEEALKCMAEGADYIGFGPVFPTQSKDDAGPATGIEAMRSLSKLIALPFIAIGGINSANVPDIIGAGAYGIAVISAVCCSEDPEGAVRILKEALDNGSKACRHR